MTTATKEDKELQSLRVIIQNLRNIRETEKLVAEQIETLYPVGSRVGWQKGGNNLSGVVVRHSSIFRILVRNDLTEKEYVINISDVIVRNGLSDELWS